MVNLSKFFTGTGLVIIAALALIDGGSWLKWYKQARDWEAALRSNEESVYFAFADKHQHGVFSDEALNLGGELYRQREEDAWSKAKSEGTSTTLSAFIEEFTDSTFERDALARLRLARVRELAPNLIELAANEKWGRSYSIYSSNINSLREREIQKKATVIPVVLILALEQVSGPSYICSENSDLFVLHGERPAPELRARIDSLIEKLIEVRGLPDRSGILRGCVGLWPIGPMPASVFRPHYMEFFEVASKKARLESKASFAAILGADWFNTETDSGGSWESTRDYFGMAVPIELAEKTYLTDPADEAALILDVQMHSYAIGYRVSRRFFAMKNFGDASLADQGFDDAIDTEVDVYELSELDEMYRNGRAFYVAGYLLAAESMTITGFDRAEAIQGLMDSAAFRWPKFPISNDFLMQTQNDD